jgi:hypothetical protein
LDDAGETEHAPDRYGPASPFELLLLRKLRSADRRQKAAARRDESMRRERPSALAASVRPATEPAAYALKEKTGAG